MPPTLRQILLGSLVACSVASRIQAQPPASNRPAEEIVQLPAFVMEESTFQRPDATLVHWYHAEIPGIEILSCLSASDTAKTVAALQDQVRLLTWELPAELRPPPGRPLQLVLDVRPFTPLRMPVRYSSSGSGARRVWSILVGMSDWDFASYYLSDERAGAMVGSDSRRMSAAPLIFASGTWLEQKPAPSWLSRFWTAGPGVWRYVQGGSVIFEQDAIFLADKDLSLPSLSIAFANPNWRPVEPKPKVTDAVQAGRWFVRWALYADEGAHREAFWDFVKASTLQPQGDEALVRKHFGLAFAELDARVSQFRTKSQRASNLRFKIPPAPAVSPVAIRDATDTEIGCMLGQWALLAWRQNPRLAVPLSEAARRILTRANKQSGNDPRSVALLGLVELAAGNPDKARPLLESVAGFAELTPRARFELAKLRCIDALAKPVANGKFDAGQLAGILSPLAPFRAEAPGDSNPVALIALAWSHAATPPSRDELVPFVSLARQYPRDDQLLLQTALLCLQANLNREAAGLVETELAFIEKEDTRAAFLKLKTQIEVRLREPAARSN